LFVKPNCINGALNGKNAAVLYGDTTHHGHHQGCLFKSPVMFCGGPPSIPNMKHGAEEEFVHLGDSPTAQLKSCASRISRAFDIYTVNIYVVGYLIRNPNLDGFCHFALLEYVAAYAEALR